MDNEGGDKGAQSSISRNELKDLQTQVQDYKDTIEFLEKTTQFLQEENDRLIKERDQGIKESKKQQVVINEHKISINHLLNELKSVKGQGIDYKNKLDDLNEKVFTLSKEKDVSLNETDKIQGNLNSLQNDFAKLKEEKEGLAKEKEAFQIKDKKISDQVASLVQANQQFKISLSDNDIALKDSLKKLNEKEDKVKEFISQLQTLSLKNEKYAQNIDDFKTMTASLESQVKTLANENNTIKKELVNSKNLSDSLDSDKQNNLVKIADLEKENRKQQEIVVKLKMQDLAKLNKEKIALTDTIESYRAMLAESKEELSNVIQSKSQMNEKLVKVEDVINNIEERNKELEKESIEFAKTLKELSQLRNKLSDAQENNRIIGERILQDNKTADREKAELKKVIEENKLALLNRDKELEKIKDENSRFLNQLAKTDNDNEILKSEKERLEEVVAQLKVGNEKYSRVYGQLTQAKKEVETLREENSVFKGDILKLRLVKEENSQLVNQLANAKKDITTLRRENGVLDEATSQLREVNAQRSQLANQLAKAVKDIELFRQENIRLKDDVSMFIKQVADLNKDKVALRGSEINYLNKVKGLENQIDKYGVSVSKIEENLNQVKQEKNALDNNLKKVESEKENIETSNVELKEENTRLTEKISDIEKMVVSLSKTEKENQEYAAKVMRLEEEVKDYKALIVKKDFLNEEKIKQASNKWKKSIDEYVDKLAELTIRSEKKDSEKKELVSKTDDLNKGLNEANAKNIMLEKEKLIILKSVDDFNAVKDELKLTKNQRQEYSNRMQALEKEVTSYKGLMAKAEKEFTNKLNDIAKETDNKFNNRVAELNGTINEYKIAMTKTLDELTQIKVEGEKSKKEIGNLDETLNLVRNRNENLTKEKQDLISMVENLSAVKGELSAAQGRNKEYTNKIDFLENENDKYKKILAQKDKIIKGEKESVAGIINNHKGSLAELNSKIKQISMEKEAVVNNVSSLSSSLQVALENNKQLQTEKQGFLVKIKAIDEVGNKISNELKSVKDEKQGFLGKLNVLQNKIKKYKDLLARRDLNEEEKINNETARLQNVVNSYKGSLSETTAELKNIKDKNNEYAQEIDSLEKSRDLLQAQNKSLQESNESLELAKSKQAEEVEAINGNSRQIQDQLTKEVNTLRGDIQDFRTKKDIAYKKIEALTEEIKQNKELFAKEKNSFDVKIAKNTGKFNNAIDEYKTQLSSIRKELTKTAAEKNEYMNNLRETQNQLAAVKNSENMIQKERSLLVKKLQHLDSVEQEFKEVQNDNLKYLARIDELQKAQQSEKNVYSDNINRMKNELSERIESLEKNNQEYKNSLDEIASRLTKENSKNREYMSEIGKLENSLEMANNKLNIASEDKQKISEMNKDLIGKYDVAKKEQENLRAGFAKQVGSLRYNIEKLSQEKNQYSEKIKNAKKKLSERENQLVSIETESKQRQASQTEQINQIIREHQVVLHKMQESLNESQMGSKAYRDKIENLENQIVGFKENDSIFHNEKETLVKKIQELTSIQNDYSELRKQAQSYQGQLDVLQKEKNKYQKLVNENSSQLQDKFSKEIQVLNDENNKYKASLDQTNKNFKEVNSKNIEYKNRVQNSEEALKVLKQGYASLEKEKELAIVAKDDQIKENISIQDNSSELKTVFAQKEQVFKEAIKKFQEKEKSLENVLVELKEVKLEKEKYISQINDFNKTVQVLKGRIENIENKKDMFAQKTEKLQEIIDAFKKKEAQNHNYLATINVLQKEIDKSNKLLSERKESDVFLSDESGQQLKERICYLEEKCDRIEKSKEELAQSYEAKRFYDSVSLKKENARLRRVLANMTDRFESTEEKQDEKYFSEAQNLRE